MKISYCFRPFFAFMLKMLSDSIISKKKIEKTGTKGGTIFGLSMLFECIGICVCSPAHEFIIRGFFFSFFI